ncbi:MAG: 50S ribosomal protein L13 [Thermoplasmatota archaeon]
MSGAKHTHQQGKATGVTTVIDATGLVLGRMATDVAKRAKNGETVHIVNAEKAIIVGASKEAIQERYRFKREVGTARKGPFFPREPHLIVKRTVRGMLPYQKSDGRAAYKRIQAHIGVPKELAGTDAISIDHANRDAKSFMTVLELSRFLGSPDRSA